MKLLVVCYRSPQGELIIHPAHEKMLEDYDYDILYAEKNWVPVKKMYESSLSNLMVDIDYNNNKNKKYDAILLESPASLHAADKISNNYNSKIIYLNSNWMLWPELAHGFYKNYSSVFNIFFTLERKLNKKMLIKRLEGNVDYAISVSEFCDKKLSDVCDLESYIVEPYIEEDRYKRLKEISPELDKKRAIFIGENRNHKGIEVMVDAWSKVRDIHPEAEFYIIGECHPDSFNQYEGVHNLGYVSDEEIIENIRKSSLYLHTARFENFGISIIEAMRGGVPCIVSENTGTKDIVSEVDDSLVVERKIDSISKRVNEYFDMDRKKRKEYSNKSKEVTDGYTLERSKNMMEKAIENILD